MKAKDMQVKYFLIGIVAVLMAGSCDFRERYQLVSNDVDTLLDYSSEEFVTAEEYEEDIARIRSEVDIKIDSLRSLMESNHTFSSNRFHMITGSFRNPSNAQNYMQKMKSMGYNSTIIQNPNGLDMVSVKSYNNLRTAVTEINNFRSALDVPAWIYITR